MSIFIDSEGHLKFHSLKAEQVVTVKSYTQSQKNNQFGVYRHSQGFYGWKTNVLSLRFGPWVLFSSYGLFSLTAAC